LSNSAQPFSAIALANRSAYAIVVADPASRPQYPGWF